MKSLIASKKGDGHMFWIIITAIIALIALGLLVYAAIKSFSSANNYAESCKFSCVAPEFCDQTEEGKCTTTSAVCCQKSNIVRVEQRALSMKKGETKTLVFGAGSIVHKLTLDDVTKDNAVMTINSEPITPMPVTVPYRTDMVIVLEDGEYTLRADPLYPSNGPLPDSLNIKLTKDINKDFRIQNGTGPGIANKGITVQYIIADYLPAYASETSGAPLLSPGQPVKFAVTIKEPTTYCVVYLSSLESPGNYKLIPSQSFVGMSKKDCEETNLEYTVTDTKPFRFRINVVKFKEDDSCKPDDKGLNWQNPDCVVTSFVAYFESAPLESGTPTTTRDCSPTSTLDQECVCAGNVYIFKNADIACYLNQKTVSAVPIPSNIPTNTGTPEEQAIAAFDSFVSKYRTAWTNSIARFTATPDAIVCNLDTLGSLPPSGYEIYIDSPSDNDMTISLKNNAGTIIKSTTLDRKLCFIRYASTQTILSINSGSTPATFYPIRGHLNHNALDFAGVYPQDAGWGVLTGPTDFGDYQFSKYARFIYLKGTGEVCFDQPYISASAATPAIPAIRACS